MLALARAHFDRRLILHAFLQALGEALVELKIVHHQPSPDQSRDVALVSPGGRALPAGARAWPVAEGCRPR